jgi:hypothetical protein
MTKDEALKMVIENLELQEFNTVNATLISYCKEALATNKESSLVQPAQEPVAYNFEGVLFFANEASSYIKDSGQPLYTHSTPDSTPAHQWQGLTDDEILAIPVGSRLSTARAIEQALKEKNHG